MVSLIYLNKLNDATCHTKQYDDIRIFSSVQGQLAVEALLHVARDFVYYYKIE